MLTKIQTLYRDYDMEYRELERTRKPGAGLLGLGGGPKDDPCHERFAASLEGMLREAAETSPGEAGDILEFIWFTQTAPPKGWDAGSWMRLAVHSLTPPLISRLSQEEAAGLLERYQAAYPRRTRLPAQEAVVSTLKKQAKMQNGT